MARRGSGFGFVLLVVVLAVVLLLVARSWRSVAPTAVQVATPAGAVSVDAHGEEAAAAAVRRGALPDLREMRQETGAHAQEVQDALAATE